MNMRVEGAENAIASLGADEPCCPQSPLDHRTDPIWGPRRRFYSPLDRRFDQPPSQSGLDRGGETDVQEEPPTHFVARGGIDSCPVSHAGQGIEFYDVATAGVFPDVQRSTTPLLRDSRLPADPMHAPPLFDNRPCIGGDHGVILGTVPDGDCWPRSLVIRSVAEFRSQGLTIRQTVPSHAIEGLRDCRRRLIRQA